MKRLLLVAVVALVCAAPASAKEILGLQVCGASGCNEEKGKQISGVLHEGPGGPLTDNGQAVAPAKPGPWYRVFALFGDGQDGIVRARIPFYYVPAAHTIVQPGEGAMTTTWMRANATWQAVLDRIAQDVDAFAAPTITRVSLNGENAADPQSYLKLYTVGSKATTYPKDVTSTQIVLESKTRTPWTDGNYVVLYPKSNLLTRDGQIVSIPGDISDAAAAGQSLDVGKSFPWLAVWIALAVAALVAAAMLVARRMPARGQRPLPQA
jgi:hypothetical protein